MLAQNSDIKHTNATSTQLQPFSMLFPLGELYLASQNTLGKPIECPQLFVWVFQLLHTKN